MSLPPVLLLVEDDADDRRLLRHVLRKSPARLVVDVALDGRSAVEYLTRICCAQTTRRPFLVLSDIHLPLLTGWELLAWIRARPELEGLPVMLWTSLPNPEGEDRARLLGAAAYVGKPRDLEGFRRLAARLSSRWGD